VKTKPYLTSDEHIWIAEKATIEQASQFISDKLAPLPKKRRTK